jgi:hypothetical protein
LNELAHVISAPIKVQVSSQDIIPPNMLVVLKENSIITAEKVKDMQDLVVEILSTSTAQHDNGLKKG